MDKGDAFVLVDVREPQEIAISQLPGSLKIPLGSLPANVNKLSTADAIVVHCRTGGRSAKAVEFLMAAGFRKVSNLTGGIDRWAVEIDPTVPRY
jgi:adenylyltransferase/sulfurtransferase